MAKMRARIMSEIACFTRAGSRRSGMKRASRSAIPSRRSAWARSMTPPSDDKRPPSKAAVIFLRDTAGNGNVAVVWSGMAGVAALKVLQDRLQQPNPTLLQVLKLHPPAFSSHLVHKNG